MSPRTQAHSCYLTSHFCHPHCPPRPRLPLSDWLLLRVGRTNETRAQLLQKERSVTSQCNRCVPPLASQLHKMKSSKSIWSRLESGQIAKEKRQSLRMFEETLLEVDYLLFAVSLALQAHTSCAKSFRLIRHICKADQRLPDRLEKLLLHPFPIWQRHSTHFYIPKLAKVKWR